MKLIKVDSSDFTFQHIIFLSNRDLWLLLAENDNVTILQACQKADDLVLFRIRSVFSKTAVEYFNDDLNKFCGTSKAQTVEARNRMAKVLSELYEQGRLHDWDVKYAS